MEINYYAETDSLYIQLPSKPGVDSQEAAPGVALDFDADGKLIGIDIDHASTVTSLASLDVAGLSVSSLTLAK